jgi:hypothetical protein
LTDREWSGVWLSDRPLDNSEGAGGETLLHIEIPEEIIATYEWVEEGKPFRVASGAPARDVRGSIPYWRGQSRMSSSFA